MNSTPAPLPATAIKPTHIVGVGASAGGLSALEQFFDNMPTDTAMAFVVIQHLSPDFKSLMDDLLARHTSMPIYRVTNGIELCPDSIYLIPPKTHMTISGEKLYLTERTINPQNELPIDIFFHSLAEDVGDRAVGVVLSGTGSDGSRGIISIHKKGGLVVIQSPESAQFDGMPRNAIATGVCDFILAPDRIPRILVEYAISPLTVRNRINQELEVLEDEGEYAGIFALLRRSYNLDFSKYKGATVGRRIRRRMEFRQIMEIIDYTTIVSGDLGELELLYKDLLIGVTEFFRDKQAFEFLEQEVVPQLFNDLQRGEDLRVWSAACATGEEAYSLAILLAEKAEEQGFTGKITIFATDVHKTSLDFASQGLYDRDKLTNISPERLMKYFKNEGHGLFRVTSELRKLVLFAPHNLLNDPPFTRLDLVCCRNLLIYFQSEVQEKVISLLHFALKKNGTLFLGSSEGPGAFVGEFEVIANQHKMFRKTRDVKLALNLEANRIELQTSVPVTIFQPSSNRTVSIDRQVLSDYDTLLRQHIPPGVLIDENRNIIHYFGNVAEYLKAPEGRTESNILTRVGDSLHIALSTALQRAEKTRLKIITNNVRVRHGNQEQLIDLAVVPLPDDKSRSTHYHVYFERVRPTEHALPPITSEAALAVSFDAENHFRQHLADLEIELQSTRENLQTTVEELQTSNEELQATNEEMLASNEELQSTNEELHSVNEELYSVNSEFERKNIELKQLNNDHENLLASTDIGTVFLDRQLRIRKYNPAIASFFKLLPQDIGRPIDHIAYHLSCREEMLADISRVLANGVPISTEEKTRDNSWLLKRIMPFRTEIGQVEGVVITFTDITTVKAAELKVVRLNEELENKVEERTRELQHQIQEHRRTELALRKLTRAVEQSPVSIVITDTKGTLEFVNPRFSELTGYTAEEAIGQNARILKSGKTPLEVYENLWSTISAGDTWDGEYLNKSKDGRLFWEHATISALRDDDGVITHFLAVKEDITEKKYIEDQFIIAKEQAEAANLAKSEFLAVMSHEIRTPMNGVLGMTALLLETDLTVQQREYAKIVCNSGEKLLKIINEILDFSKIESGNLELEAVNFDLRVTIEEAVRLFAQRIAEAGLEMTCRIDPGVPSYLQGDPGKLYQIIINLIGNALKFTHHGSIVIGALLSSEEDNSATIRFEISDTGIGIPPDRLDLIFAPFTQVDGSTTRKYGGTGLGLTICKQLAELMGGEIGVSSTEGAGSTFWFTARFEKQTSRASKIHRQSTREQITSNRSVEAETSGHTARILVADDDIINRKVAQEILKVLGYQADVVADGQKAVQALELVDYDLVLMDCMMPVMGGFEATALIRSSNSKVLNHKVPVIALTAKAIKGDREKCLAVGMDDYMTKPLNKEIVMRMIGTWLSGNSRPVAAAPEAGDHTERLSSTDETLNELNQPPLPSQRVKL